MGWAVSGYLYLFLINMEKLIAKVSAKMTIGEADKIIQNLLKNFHPEDEIEVDLENDFSGYYIVINILKKHSHLKVIK